MDQKFYSKFYYRIHHSNFFWIPFIQEAIFRPSYLLHKTEDFCMEGFQKKENCVDCYRNFSILFKGRLISKCLFGVFNSPKNKRKHIRYQRDISKLYVNYFSEVLLFFDKTTFKRLEQISGKNRWFFGENLILKFSDL
jgi:hypothetical protein